MDSNAMQHLERDCEAVQIPAGNTVTLPAGTAVDITQMMGGTVTVRALDGLFRIAGKDADALGLDPAAIDDEPKPGEDGGQVSEQQVWSALRLCYDPEIPINIVDLGLVYDLVVEPQPSGAAKVAVKMTLTAPGCGMGPVIAADAQQRIMSLPGVHEATVELVWDPPWHQSMITIEGRRKLGLE
jgi:probable FeS assembly SUF system protein SufT